MKTLSEFVEEMKRLAGRKNLVIAVDIDGFLCQGQMWDENECFAPIRENVEMVNQLYKHHFIILHTARRYEMAQSTLKWLKSHNVYYHAIHFEKMPADLYLDDKAFNPFLANVPSDEEPYP